METTQNRAVSIAELSSVMSGLGGDSGDALGCVAPAGRWTNPSKCCASCCCTSTGPARWRPPEEGVQPLATRQTTMPATAASGLLTRLTRGGRASGVSIGCIPVARAYAELERSARCGPLSGAEAA